MSLILHGMTAVGWLNVRNMMTAGSRFPFMRQAWDSGNQGKELVTFAKEKGYTHVELHPVMEFLEDGSDGYPTSAYFAVSTRYGTPARFCSTGR